MPTDRHDIADHVNLVVRDLRIACRVTARFCAQDRYDLEDLETGERYWAVWGEDIEEIRPALLTPPTEPCTNET